MLPNIELTLKYNMATGKAAAKNTAKKTKGDTIEDLANLLHKSLNEGSSEDIAFLLTQDNPSQIKDWVSTGCDMLDIAISNRPNGGLPVGRIIEITGLESSGKSLLGATILKNTQEMGGLPVLIDTETSVSTEFLEAIGLDINKMSYISVDMVEDIFEVIEKIIAKVRASSKDRLVTILVDSVAAASCKTEMASEHGKDGWATAKAIIISKALRKITSLIGRERILLVFTNQLRRNISVTYGDPWCVDPYTTKIKIRYKVENII